MLSCIDDLPSTDDYNHALKERVNVTAQDRHLLLSEVLDSGTTLGEWADQRIRSLWFHRNFGTILSRGRTETNAKREVEGEIARRLAALEAADPSQSRPTPRANVNSRVDYIDFN